MGDDGHGHALLGKIPHQVQHLTHHLGVQGGGGLVEQHDLRIHGQSADDRDPLLLAAGEHIGELVGLVGKANALQQGHGLLLGCGGSLFLQGHGGHGDVLQHRLVGKQVEVLEHHAHLLTVQVDVHRLARQIRTVEEDGAGGRLLQQIQTPQQRGFAGAGGADDGHHLALVDVQIAVVQGVDGAVIVLLYQMLDGDQDLTACRHGASSFRWPQCPWRPDN